MEQRMSFAAGFRVAGAGPYDPASSVTSDALDERHGRAPGTSLKLGIRERRYASADETSSFMAAAAARGAPAGGGEMLQGRRGAEAGLGRRGLGSGGYRRPDRRLRHDGAADPGNRAARP